MGRALRSYRAGEEVFVFTKCGRRWEGRPEGLIGNDLRPESIREECELSLHRLGLERIDLYQVHWPDWTTGTLLEEAWGTMAELVDEGKARWIGVCNFDVEQLDRCEAVRHVDAVQPPLSLLARGVLGTVVPWAAAHGAGVLGYSPLASGMLTGAYDRRRIAGLAEDDWRRAAPAYNEPLLSQNLALVERLGRDRGTARRDAARACRRVGAGAAGRHREYRRFAPAGTRRRLGGRGRPRAGRPSAPRDQRGDHRHRGWVGRAPCPAAAHQARPGIEPEPRSPRMRLGLLSTANINRAILAGASATGARRGGGRRESRRSPRAVVRRRARDPVGARLVRRPPRRPGGRRRLHLAPERHAPPVDDEGSRRGQACPLREAVLPPPRRGGGGLRCRLGRRARARRGVHVPPPPADGHRAPAGRGRRAGPPLRRQDDVQLPASRPVQRPGAARARRRRPDGRRLLLRQRDPAARRRSGARARRAGHRADGRRHGVPRDAPLRRRRGRPVRGVVPLAPAPAARGCRGGRGSRGRGSMARRPGRIADADP